MGKRILFFVMILGTLFGAHTASASTVASRHRERCTPHLSLHADLGYAPFALQLSEHGFELSELRHGIFALKPSLSLCRFEAHLVAEVTLSHEFGLRFGGEAFTRPARWLPDSWRFFDAIALGAGMTVGTDRALEVGPRLLFDATEWLAFVLATNLHLRLYTPRESEFVLSGGIQLSLPHSH